MLMPIEGKKPKEALLDRNDMGCRPMPSFARASSAPKIRAEMLSTDSLSDRWP
jgi:hypothetical protein